MALMKVLFGILVVAAAAFLAWSAAPQILQWVMGPPDINVGSPVPPPTTQPPLVLPSSATPDIRPAISLALPVSSADAFTGSLVSRTYSWEYGGKKWTWELQLPESLYDYFKSLPRSPTANYSVYVTHPMDDAYLGQLVSKIQDASQAEGYSEYQTVGFLAAFVQSLPYVTDDLSTGFDEYPRYPIETLLDNGGDCEDTSILMASLIKGLGYDVVLIVLPKHVGVGVQGGDGIFGTYWNYQGVKYYYLETTGEGWELGELPPEYKGASASVYPMKPVPILTHEWTSTAGVGYVGLNIEVSNLGSAEASGVYIYAGFDAGNDQVWNHEESPPFDIGIDEKVTVSMRIRVPYNEHTRLLVQVVYNGYAVDESQSKWLDT